MLSNSCPVVFGENTEKRFVKTLNICNHFGHQFQDIFHIFNDSRKKFRQLKLCRISNWKCRLASSSLRLPSRNLSFRLRVCPHRNWICPVCAISLYAYMSCSTKRTQCFGYSSSHAILENIHASKKRLSAKYLSAILTSGSALFIRSKDFMYQQRRLSHDRARSPHLSIDVNFSS